MKLPRRPEFNHAIGYIGPPRSGKTDLAMHQMLAFRREHPIYLLAHDPQYAIPDKLHDGMRTNLHRYETVAELARGVARNPEGVHVSMEPDATPLVAYSARLAELSMHRADPKKHEAPCAPVAVYVDEVASCEEMSEGKLGPELRDALMKRRHRHVAILWGTQSPHRIHYEYLGNGTALHVFRLHKRRDLKRLADDSGFTDEEMEMIPRLGQHKYITHTL